MNRLGVILAAHGSRLEPEVNQRILALAVELQRRIGVPFFTAAFHHGVPSFDTVLDSLDVDDVIVIPLMTSEGYYSNEVLPAALAANRRFATIRVHQTPPLGSHPDMLPLMLERIRELRCRFNISSGEASIVLVGHGTPRNPQSRKTTLALADNVRQSTSTKDVIAVFLDDEPPIEQALQRVQGKIVIVIPFLIGIGPHALRDVPTRIGLHLVDGALPPFVGCVGGRSVICDAPIGSHPRIVDMLVDLVTRFEMISAEGTPLLHRRGSVRADDADRDSTQSVSRCSLGHSEGEGLRADFSVTERKDRSPNGEGRVLSDESQTAESPALVRPRHETDAYNRRNDSPRRALRLGTRNSALALWQAQHVAERLCGMGAGIEIVELSTLGDRMLDRAIAELPGVAPFTEDIDHALSDRRIDLAVHSLKDLPLEIPSGLTLAAVLRRGDPSESLVSQKNRTLAELPSGARVGTSSPRRRAQLLAIRPDVLPVILRGPVDDRIRQVRRGELDAAILATVGLERLSRLDEIAERFSLHWFLPAPGQGALAVMVREEDAEVRELCRALDHAPTRIATRAELDVLSAFELRKDVVVAAYATWENDTCGISLRAKLLTMSGKCLDESRVCGPNADSVCAQVIERFQSAIRIAHLQPESVGVAS